MPAPEECAHSLARQVSVQLQKLPSARGGPEGGSAGKPSQSSAYLSTAVGMSRSISGNQGGKERYFKWKSRMGKGRRYETI